MNKVIRNVTIALLAATAAIMIVLVLIMASYYSLHPAPSATTPAVTLTPTTPPPTDPTTTPPPADPTDPANTVPVALIDKGTPGPGKFDTRPIETPGSLRVIEVVDRIAPTRWDVRKAVKWIDRYTASRMVLVSRCSGKAWRCITFQTGDVKGSKVAYTSGNTITLDLVQANGSMHRYYKLEKNRTWLLTHELGHAFGLTHSTRYAKNLMNPYVNRYRMALTVAQSAALARR